MPQRSKLFAGTVAENIVGIGNSFKHDDLQHAMKLAALDDLLASQQVGENGLSLSGGQAQRVCLARAFYRVITRDSKFLVLDEPISALDEARAATVVTALTNFTAQGKTVIAVSHQSRVIKAADQVIEVTGVQTP
jgi:ATP-binding cassette subfamily C protein CydD